MKTYIDSIKASPNVPDVAPEVILVIQARSRIEMAIAILAEREETIKRDAAIMEWLK